MTPHSLHSVKQGAQKEIKNKSSRQALCLTYKLHSILFQGRLRPQMRILRASGWKKRLREEQGGGEGKPSHKTCLVQP